MGPGKERKNLKCWGQQSIFSYRAITVLKISKCNQPTEKSTTDSQSLVRASCWNKPASPDWGTGVRRPVTGSVNQIRERVLSKPQRQSGRRALADLEMDQEANRTSPQARLPISGPARSLVAVNSKTGKKASRNEKSKGFFYIFPHWKVGSLFLAQIKKSL